MSVTTDLLVRMDGHPQTLVCMHNNICIINQDRAYLEEQILRGYGFLIAII